MKKILLTSLLAFLGFSATAQLSSVPNTIVDDLPKYVPHNPNLKLKGPLAPKACTEDTLEYGRYKATAFQAIGISDGFALGQYYDAPDTVTVSGTTFYGWTISTNNDSVTVTVSLYNVGLDTLPTGPPIRTKNIKLDTLFNGGQLSTLRKSITFDTPYTTDKPYIITISSLDTVRVGVVCNSYDNGDGANENIACGTVSNFWYRCLNLNIAGTTLNCDVLLEPHTKYNTFADFTFADCYKWQDSLAPTNLSSPILSHRMYNRYISYGLGQYSYYWYGGAGSSTVYGENPKIKYAFPTNRNVRLVTTMYGYRNGIGCRDTAYQMISYQPDEITLSTDTPVCSGDIAIISALSNGKVYWYSSPTASTPIDSGGIFTSPPLFNNKSYYTRSINSACTTSTRQAIISVAEKPSIPTVLNDSICLNAKANLTATTDFGNIIWWSDSIGGIPLDTGMIYTSKLLSSSAKFYAEANNRGCISSKRTEAIANVNSNNAPTAPLTNLDSLICIHDGQVTLTATSASGDSIRWFDVPSFGNQLHTGNSFTFSPNQLGTQQFFIDAYDGQCASSRIEKKLLVWSFPNIGIKDKDTICLGDTLTIDYSEYIGSIRWYDANSGGTIVYDSSIVQLFDFTGNITYYLEPYSEACLDTTRHSVTVSGLNPGTLSNIMSDNICENKQATISAETDAGEVIWSLDSSFSEVLKTGVSYTTPPLTANQTYFVASRNIQCFSPHSRVEVDVRKAPNAGYNYQVNDIADFTFTADQAGLNYSWDLGDGTSSTSKTVNHVYTKNGNFTVVLTVADSKSCNKKSSRVIKVAGLITGIAESSVVDIKIYPNPASSQLYIETNQSESLVTIYNHIGANVSQTQLINGMVTMDISHLSNGIYHLEVKNGKSTATKKLVINRY
ncbi:MAG: hypothetical protein COA58_02410 [Bacteroidetes bacterium]|nr:MAG: hypothetical protein COA58_02410 [Bacteroidota bacterium]